MIKVTLGSNTKTETVLLEKTTTFRKALEDAGINTTTGKIFLSGKPLAESELDGTFERCSTDEVTLVSVVKADGGM